MKALLVPILSMIFLQSTTYKLQTENFEVVLPAKPDYRTQSVNTGVATLNLHLYILEQGPTYYIISHSYYPPSIDLSDPEKFFRGVISGMISNYQGTLLHEQTLNKDKGLGKKVRIELPDGDLVEVDYYLMDRTLYQILVKASPQEIQFPEVQNCLSSFKLY